ncbi:hypothetical protein BZA05DRAFT_409775 [Tricharina praecox]|uniref:uncharacterized protein n=1 Tax=Tricharina praecox TaxID=43433 RepID=UPI0022200C58|nr:uncharacterized protein BZA05DRAFT_409775 [Tricharina praecox]KAI5844330.1 hypothetical protein BZA05DRAFT_409775 [Tricharina praecox]
MSSFTANPYRHNAVESDSRLADSAARLFSYTDSVRAIHCDGGYKETLQSLPAIEEYVQKFSAFAGTRIIIIPQRFSWGELMVSEASLRTLLQGLGVFGEFSDLIRAFGAKTSPVDETYAVRPIFQKEASGSFRLCYLAKHVEQNNKLPKQQVDIYSVRQMAVYHGYDAQNDAHTFVLVNPSTTFQMHWLQAQKSDPQGMGWMDFHVAVAYAMSCRWREYVNHLEDKFDKTHDKSLTGPSDDDHVAFADIQNLQILKDKVLHLEHVLRLNLGVFQELQSLLQTISAPERALTACPSPAGANLKIANLFSRYLSETAVAGQRAEHLMKRIDGASTMFRTILDFTAMQSARHESESMLVLSQKGQRDSRTMKNITLLALVFLPATFVAVRNPLPALLLSTHSSCDIQTILSMKYISSTPGGGLHLANEMWIFLILTLLLLGVTLGYWKCWEHRQVVSTDTEQQRESGGDKGEGEVEMGGRLYGTVGGIGGKWYDRYRSARAKVSCSQRCRREMV